MNKTTHQLIFWTVTFAVLVGLFSQKWGSFSEEFYFTGMLLPVAAGTAYFFIHYLVPKYLWQRLNFRFGMYTTYTLVVSTFLMTCISLVSLVIFADLNWNRLNPMAQDLFQMALLTYFIAMLFSFIRMQAESRKQANQLEALKKAEARNKLSILTIRANRQNIPIPSSSTCYIESLADYVKVHTTDDLYMIKERIGKLAQKLPGHLIRIHRSYLVNQHHIDRFAGDYVIVNQLELPLGRKYKKEAIEKMKVVPA